MSISFSSIQNNNTLKRVPQLQFDEAAFSSIQNNNTLKLVII